MFVSKPIMNALCIVCLYNWWFNQWWRGMKTMKGQEIDQDVDNQYIGKSKSTKRIDLNDLLARAEIEKKKDSRTNFLILSSVAAVSLIVILIISF